MRTGPGPGPTGPAGDAQGAPKDAVLHGTPRPRGSLAPKPRPRPPAPRVGCRPRAGAAICHAQRHWSRSARPLRAGPRGAGGPRSGTPPGRHRAAPPWETPSPHQVTNIPPWRTRLQRKARSIPQPGAKPPSSPFLCWLICLLTHPEKHSPPLLPLWSSLASNQCDCFSPHFRLSHFKTLGPTEGVKQLQKESFCDKRERVSGERNEKARLAEGH